MTGHIHEDPRSDSPAAPMGWPIHTVRIGCALGTASGIGLGDWVMVGVCLVAFLLTFRGTAA